MSLLNYYPLNGNGNDVAMNYGFYIDPDSLTYVDFGIGKGVNSDMIIGEPQSQYNININEFCISFLYKFPSDIPVDGGQIFFSGNVGIVCYPDKIEVYKGFEYEHGSENTPFTKMEYTGISLSDSIQFFTVGYDEDNVHLFMNGKHIQSMPNTIKSEPIRLFGFINIGVVSNIWTYDEFPSDKIIMEMYKNKLFQYDFDVNLNMYPNMLNKVKNGNTERGILYWECGIDNILEESYINHGNQSIKFFKLSRDIGTGVSMKQTVTDLDSLKSYWLTYNEFDSNANIIVHREILISNVSTYDVIITSENSELLINEIMVNEMQSIPYISYIPAEYVTNEIQVRPCDISQIESQIQLTPNVPIWDKKGFYGDGSLKLENSKIIFPTGLQLLGGSYIIKSTCMFTKFATNTPLMLFHLGDAIPISLSIVSGNLMLGDVNLNHTLDLNVWYSFTIVVINAAEMKLYINDMLIGTYAFPMSCFRIKNFGFNDEPDCTGLIDEISMYYHHKLLSEAEINEMYLDSELVAVIDNNGGIWAKGFTQQRGNIGDVKLAVDADKRILNLPQLREVGRNSRYIRVICDDTVDTITPRFMEISKIECVVDGNIIKTIYGTHISNESGELILEFDLGAVYNVEIFRVYFNAYTNTTEYVNKRFSVSVDNDKWSSNYYPHDTKSKTEQVNVPTEFLMYDNIVHVDGDSNITNAYKVYKL
jgi:hypothetical protein